MQSRLIALRFVIAGNANTASCVAVGARVRISIIKMRQMDLQLLFRQEVC